MFTVVIWKWHSKLHVFELLHVINISTVKQFWLKIVQDYHTVIAYRKLVSINCCYFSYVHSYLLIKNQNKYFFSIVATSQRCKRLRRSHSFSHRILITQKLLNKEIQQKEKVLLPENKINIIAWSRNAVITHDRELVKFSHTSFMNILSNFTVILDQAKVHI